MKTPSKKTKTKKVKKVSFSKLSKPQKRVAIAKDVLMQIKRGKYIAGTGSYITNVKVEGVRGNAEGYFGKIKSQPIKENFAKIQECTVCAMGACLMSITKFENKLDFGEVGSGVSAINNEKVKELFSSLFEPLQLLLIERAFEGDSGGTLVAEQLFNLDECDSDIRKQVIKCEKFYQRFTENEDKLSDYELTEQREKNDELRLTAIMENIIRNKGTFKL